MEKYHYHRATSKFAWSQVAAAFWLRYPNPHSKHVLTEDVVARWLTPDGQLFTRRLLTKTNNLPRWGERFMPGPKHVCSIEESVVNPQSRTITTYTRNISMNKIMTVEEKCVYKPNIDGAPGTVIEKQVWVSSSLYGFARALMAFGLERYKKNAAEAHRGLDYILRRMYASDLAAQLDATSEKLFRDNVERLKDRARKATEIAMAKTRPAVASCTAPTANAAAGPEPPGPSQ